jgi:hypothetical protein
MTTDCLEERAESTDCKPAFLAGIPVASTNGATGEIGSGTGDSD